VRDSAQPSILICSISSVCSSVYGGQAFSECLHLPEHFLLHASEKYSDYHGQSRPPFAEGKPFSKALASLLEKARSPASAPLAWQGRNAPLVRKRIYGENRNIDTWYTFARRLNGVLHCLNFALEVAKMLSPGTDRRNIGIPRPDKSSQRSCLGGGSPRN